MKIYILHVFGSPGNAIAVYLCYFFFKKTLFLPFVTASYYKIGGKKEYV